MNRFLPAIVLFLTVLPHTLVEAQDNYFSCRSCHGDAAQGSPAIHAPALAGQSADYLLRQLRYFRDGTRGSDPRDKWGQQMALMAMNLTEEQLQQVSESISAMPRNAKRMEAMPVDDQTRRDFQQCAACHGKLGEGNPGLHAPVIAGLDAVYVTTQLRNYRDGIRGIAANDVYGQQMRSPFVTSLDDASIERLAHYVQSL